MDKISYNFSKYNVNIVTIIEKNKKSKLSNINDLRTSAISQGSSRILTNLNIWNKIENKAQLINSILVKDGKMSKINFDSESISEGPLGYIIENKILKEFVFKELTKNDLIDIYYDVEIQEIENKNAVNFLTLIFVLLCLLEFFSLDFSKLLQPIDIYHDGLIMPDIE